MDLHEGPENEKGDRSVSTSLSPNKLYNKDSHFYKIIVSPSTQSHKIRIPEDYVKKYEQRQLKKGYVRLRVPDGKVWRVELCKESGNVWLTKGWEVFYKSYGLDYGYFILFRYDKGYHKFYVTIFGLTSCEIEYNLVFHDYMGAPKMRELSSQVEDMDLGDCNGKNINNPDDGLAVQDETRVNKFPNPRFEVVMRLNNISNRYDMTFPYRHVKEHLKADEKHLELIWTTPNGKRYVIKLNVIRKRCLSRLNNGQWRRFVEDNDLQKGDICAFELVKPESNSYKVTILRASK